MASPLRTLLGHGRNLIQHSQSRRMANWHRPRFVGGDAQLHEIGRYFKQLLYTDGEKVFAFVFCFTAPVFMGLRFFWDEEWLEKRSKWCDKNVKTLFHYPTATRDED